MQFKLNIGDMTEDAVQAFVEEAFSSDFVFRSPRLEDSKEVTDVLVLFDDVGLVIQSKAQAISSDSHDSSGSIDWASKNLTKAARQVNGAIRVIQAGRLQFVENLKRGCIPYPTNEIKWLYGLIVLHHKSEPYDPFKLAPDLSKIKAPVHVLSYSDFWNLSKLLDTPADLINYFEHRTDVLIPTLTPKVHEEQEVFSYYLNRLEDVTALRARARGDVFTAEDARSYADNLRKYVAGAHPDQKCGLIIDHIIDRLHDLDPELEALDMEGHIAPYNDRTVYARVATELGKIPRVRRIALGKQYLRIAKLAAESGEQQHVCIHSLRRSDCILFIASPLSRSERRNRAKDLLAMTALAKVYHQVHRTIGIATEPAGQMGSSYDIVFLESPPEPDERAQELGREIFGESMARLADNH